MTTTTALSSFQRDAAARLVHRRDELRAMLQESAAAVVEGAPEVMDFKDVAAEDTRAAVDDIALGHAAEELAQVVAALRRLDDGTYGTCQDCGDTIDARRLQALPATPFCTDCQAAHERQGTPHR
ncbi:MAG: TraR/DksA family transcriptional regulator [Ramlibacter sp.]